MTGVVGNVNKIKDICWDDSIKEDICPRGQCLSRCKKKYPKGDGLCFPQPKGPQQCKCAYQCP